MLSKKYGKQNFTRRVLLYCQTREEALSKEIFYIRDFYGKDKLYNITDGGQEVVVYDGETDVTDEVVSVDYMFGIVTFDAEYTIVGAVTVDGAYLTAAVNVYSPAA